MLKANVAKFWKTIPWNMRGLPEQELRRMGEYAIRAREAEKEAIDAARMGMPTPGRAAQRKPGPNDVIVDPKKGKTRGPYAEYDGF